MRFAPKMLGPWERIDRLIDDRCAEAHEEIKRMTAEAVEALPRPPLRSVPYDNTLMLLAQNAAYAYGGGGSGLRALSDYEMQQRQIGNYPGMQQAAHPWYANLGNIWPTNYPNYYPPRD